MPSYFCPNCGTKTEGNTVYTKETEAYSLTCPCCLAGIRFYIPLKPSRTLEEAEAIFQQTELTDYQRTGRANTGKWARKKKVISSSLK